MEDHMLTTTDNPFDPFTEFDAWFQWDAEAGYHSSQLLARVCATSNDLSEEDQSQAIEDAIEEIVNENYLGVHMRVTRGMVLGLRR